MADRTWPPALRFSTVLLQLISTSRSGGLTMEGNEQVVVSPTARWKATVTIPVVDRRFGPEDERDAVLAARWVLQGGRGSTILLPARDGRGPADRAGLVPSGGGSLYSDGAKHADGTLFGQSYSGARLSEAAAMNATRLRITLGSGLRLLPGMRFSLPGGRLHEIADLIDWDGGTLWTVRVGPWTAADWPVGTHLEFERPVCRMRLASDETGALSLSLNRFATASIDFVEAF